MKRAHEIEMELNKLKSWWLSQMAKHAPVVAQEMAELEIELQNLQGPSGPPVVK